MNGLTSAVGTGAERHTIRSIYNAIQGTDDKRLEQMWANRSHQEAYATLSRPDVSVTNQSDKEGQLPKIEQLDTQVKEREARTLLKRCMAKLTAVAEQNNIAVIVITAAKAYSKRHKALLDIVDKQCNQKLLGKRKRQGGVTKMW